MEVSDETRFRRKQRCSADEKERPVREKQGDSLEMCMKVRKSVRCLCRRNASVVS